MTREKNDDYRVRHMEQPAPVEDASSVQTKLYSCAL